MTSVRGTSADLSAYPNADPSTGSSIGLSAYLRVSPSASADPRADSSAEPSAGLVSCAPTASASPATSAMSDPVRLPCGVSSAPRSRGLIETLLVMAGIERNPGPEAPMHEYTAWTRDFSRNVWPIISCTEISLSARVKRLLKYFDPRTRGGGVVYAGVVGTMQMSNEALKNEYFPELEGNFTDDHKWRCLKKNLDHLLPAVSALDAEAELSSLKKDSKESLLQFICRFQAVMYAYEEGQLNKQRAAHILLRKLPQALQRRLASEDFAALSVDFIYQKSQDYMNWLSVAPVGWKKSLGDFMDIDQVVCATRTELANPEVPVTLEDAMPLGEGRTRRPVLRGDTIIWKNVDGPRSLMTAWKKLVSTSSLFQREARDFLRSRVRRDDGLREM